MSIDVKRLEVLIAHYIEILEFSVGARSALEYVGEDPLGEISSLKELRKVLLDLLGKGVEVI